MWFLPVVTRSRLSNGPESDLDFHFATSVEKFFTLGFPLNFDNKFKFRSGVGWALTPFCEDSTLFSSIEKKIGVYFDDKGHIIKV